MSFASWLRYCSDVAYRKPIKFFARCLFISWAATLQGAKFTLRPSLALSHIYSVTARHSSSGRQPNCAAFSRGATYIRQGGHHVGHRHTFLVTLNCWLLNAPLWTELIEWRKMSRRDIGICSRRQSNYGNDWRKYAQVVIVMHREKSVYTCTTETWTWTALR